MSKKYPFYSVIFIFGFDSAVHAFFTADVLRTEDVIVSVLQQFP